jgi:hypothetical protein
LILWLAVGVGCSPAEPPPEPVEPVEQPTLLPPPLPIALANNAVASLTLPNGQAVFSFLGIENTKRWDGITRAAFRWNQREADWRRISPVPGPARLAATAQVVGGRVFLFGGYTVAADGEERSVPDVAIYNPAADVWSVGAPIPIPVDDAVSGVWRDSLIYLVSGWHDTNNEAAVQIYDPAVDAWQEGTPIPGPPVFGHAGGITGNSIVYLDGARVQTDPRAFVTERSSWHGEIDPADPTEIEWTRLPDHPGPALYRAAAAGGADRVIFAGGSDNPYNYDGIGYDGRPSDPVAIAFAWERSTRSWVELAPPEPATMDHRGLVEVGGRYFTVGGMVTGRRVTAGVHLLP